VDKRRKPRQQRRLSCEIWIDGKRHSAIVKDVSEVGIYLQTRARAASGTQADLVFPAEGNRAELRVQARVKRVHRLSAHLATQGAGGLGLEVVKSPPSFAPLLAAAGFTGGADAAARPARIAKG
jgi:PilZ domain